MEKFFTAFSRYCWVDNSEKNKLRLLTGNGRKNLKILDIGMLSHWNVKQLSKAVESADLFEVQEIAKFFDFFSR